MIPVYIHGCFENRRILGRKDEFQRKILMKLKKCLCRMVLEWREREHVDVEEAVQGYLMAQQAVRDCWL